MHSFQPSDVYQIVLTRDGTRAVVVREQELAIVDRAGTVVHVLDRCARHGASTWTGGHMTCDGRLFVCRIADDTRHELAAWDLTTGRRTHGFVDPPESREASFLAYVLDPTRNVCIAAGSEGGRGVFELRSVGGALSRIAVPDHQGIERLAIDADAAHLASADQQQRVVLWNLAALANAYDAARRSHLQAQLGTLPTDARVVVQLLFSPRGIALAVACEDAVLLFGASDLRLRGRFAAPGSRIRSVCFDGDARYLLVGDRVGQVHVWNVESGEHVVTLYPLPDRSMLVIRGDRYCVAGSTIRPDGWFGVIDDECRPLAAFAGARRDVAALVAEVAEALASR